jgi:hypothetical protein
VLEIALAIYGIVVLCTGKLKLSANKMVVGTPARLLGLLMLTPFPISFAVGLVVGVWAATTGRNLGDLRTFLLLGEVLIVVAVAALTFTIAHAIAKPPTATVTSLPPHWTPGPPPPPSDPNNPYQSPHV